jgi:flagellar biosynthesis component FlhA
VDARDAAAVAVATIARGRRRRVDAVEARSAPHHAARLAAVHAQRLGSRDIALRREHVRQLRDARAHGAFRLVAHFFFFLRVLPAFFCAKQTLGFLLCSFLGAPTVAPQKNQKKSKKQKQNHTNEKKKKRKKEKKRKRKKKEKGKKEKKEMPCSCTK